MMSNVDFWARGYSVDDMKLRHRLKLYPPAICVQWRPTGDLHHYCTIPVNVTGCDGDLNDDIILPFGMPSYVQYVNCVLVFINLYQQI